MGRYTDPAYAGLSYLAPTDTTVFHTAAGTKFATLPQIRGRAVYNVLDEGAIGDGVTVSTTQIQAAIDRASAAGGGNVLIPDGTFYFAAITLKSKVRIVCTPGTILKWSGGVTGANWFTTGNAAPFVAGGFIGNGCVIDANNGCGTLFDLHSIQGCVFGGFTTYNTTGYTGANDTAIYRIRSDALTRSPGIAGATTRGCAFNEFLPIVCEGAVEFVFDMQGETDGPVTLNTIHAIEASDVRTTGIRFGKYVDNNVFDGVIRMALGATSATGLIVNDSSATELFSVTLTGGGSGYTTPPAVTFTPTSGGSGAAAYAEISGGVVTGIFITNSGTGYVTAPTVGFSGGGGSGATATAFLASPSFDVKTYENTFHHLAIDLVASFSTRTGIKLNYSRSTQVLMYVYDIGLDSETGSLVNSGAVSYQINAMAGDAGAFIVDRRLGTKMHVTGVTGQYIYEGDKADGSVVFVVDDSGNIYTAVTCRADAGFYGASSVKLLSGTRQTGWTAATGTATRSTFATSTVTLQTLAEHVKALLDDLTTHGLIGT